MGLAENLIQVQQRISGACARVERPPSSVTLLAVSKGMPPDVVNEAARAGLSLFGENKVQEARAKIPLCSGKLHWHLIGHLQSNKAKDAVRVFDVIQTVDSIELAERMSRIAEAEGNRAEVLLQVNVGREEQKSGVDVEDLPGLAKRVAALPSLDLTGLMAIPPAGEAEAMRPYFRELKSLRDALGLRDLSMGMTDDFEVAIEEGATIIRVGRAIFGARG